MRIIPGKQGSWAHAGATETELGMSGQGATTCHQPLTGLPHLDGNITGKPCCRSPSVCRLPSAVFGPVWSNVS